MLELLHYIRVGKGEKVWRVSIPVWEIQAIEQKPSLNS
jgi:hypothetical protein